MHKILKTNFRPCIKLKAGRPFMTFSDEKVPDFASFFDNFEIILKILKLKI